MNIIIRTTPKGRTLDAQVPVKDVTEAREVARLWAQSEGLREVYWSELLADGTTTQGIEDWERVDS